MYDEHGSFFDHVVPPPTVAPDERTDHYAFDRLGSASAATSLSKSSKKHKERKHENN